MLVVITEDAVWRVSVGIDVGRQAARRVRELEMLPWNTEHELAGQSCFFPSTTIALICPSGSMIRLRAVPRLASATELTFLPSTWEARQLNKKDGYQLTEADERMMATGDGQLFGQFLLDREGIRTLELHRSPGRRPSHVRRAERAGADANRLTGCRLAAE